MTRRLIATLVIAMLASLTHAQICVNEFRISEPGTDTMNFVELAGGMAGGALDGHTLLSISTEFNPGEITFAIPLDGESFNADGFYVSDQTTSGVDYFGSPQAFVLVAGFTGMGGDDLDMDDDGVFDAAAPWSSVVAAVSLVDGDDNADVDYGFGVIVGPDGDFTPAHGFLTEDCGSTWEIGDFGDFSGDTPGATNVVPEPSAFALLLVGLVGIIRRRR